MNPAQNLNSTRRISLLIIFVAIAVVGTASAAVGAGLPPGHLCGSVPGASWKFQGQTGNQYNVSALPAGSCRAALKSAAALTKQKPHGGALGPRTLTGPSGFRCLGTGTIPPSSAGFCGGRNGAKFFWAPRLKN